ILSPCHVSLDICFMLILITHEFLHFTYRSIPKLYISKAYVGNLSTEIKASLQARFCESPDAILCCFNGISTYPQHLLLLQYYFYEYFKKNLSNIGYVDKVDKLL